MFNRWNRFSCRIPARSVTPAHELILTAGIIRPLKPSQVTRESEGGDLTPEVKNPSSRNCYRFLTPLLSTLNSFSLCSGAQDKKRKSFLDTKRNLSVSQECLAWHVGNFLNSPGGPRASLGKVPRDVACFNPETTLLKHAEVFL